MGYYTFQCPKCFIISGATSRNPADAPFCCDGQQMMTIYHEDETMRKLRPLDLLTAREAADISGVHLNTIYKWIKDGRLKAHKAADNPYRIARAWRIRREDLQLLGGSDGDNAADANAQNAEDLEAHKAEQIEGLW